MRVAATEPESPRARGGGDGSSDRGGAASKSPPGQKQSARNMPRLTAAPIAVCECCGPSDQAGTFVATTASMISTAIQAGITQTGSHPISRKRIDCSANVAKPKTTIKMIIDQLAAIA